MLFKVVLVYTVSSMAASQGYIIDLGELGGMGRDELMTDLSVGYLHDTSFILQK